MKRNTNFALVGNRYDHRLIAVKVGQSVPDDKIPWVLQLSGVVRLPPVEPEQPLEEDAVRLLAESLNQAKERFLGARSMATETKAKERLTRVPAS